ncbi:MAG: BON domain-containing protein [Nitrosospira sp.]|nr:BON domain-containing protein [Nitrosospira sp.]
MNDRHRSVILAATILVMSIAACTKHEDKVHESWVTPPEKAEVDDNTLGGTVKSALLADPDVKHLDIRVEANDGTVMLSGMADNQVQMDRVLMLTWMVDGTKKVDNRMSLRSRPAGV